MSPDKKNTNHEIEWNGESMPEGVPVSAVRTLMKYKKLMEHEILSEEMGGKNLFVEVGKKQYLI